MNYVSLSNSTAAIKCVSQQILQMKGVTKITQDVIALTQQ